VSTAYVTTLWLHVLAAIIWLGGMIFFATVAPVLRRIEDDAARARLFEGLGRRFRVVGWACIAVLLLTGLEQLRVRGWLSAELWGQTGFLGTALGTRLAWKLGLVAVMLGVQGAHDFWLGPRAGRATPGTPEARALRSRAAWLARVNALLGVALVYSAVRLGR
jgi:copper resistance protein D